MATIRGTIQFGVRVEITTPIAPNESLMKTVLAHGEKLLTGALLLATNSTLKVLPGVSAKLTDAKAAIKLDEPGSGS